MVHLVLQVGGGQRASQAVAAVDGMFRATFRLAVTQRTLMVPGANNPCLEACALSIRSQHLGRHTHLGECGRREQPCVAAWTCLCPTQSTLQPRARQEGRSGEWISGMFIYVLGLCGIGAGRRVVVIE